MLQNELRPNATQQSPHTVSRTKMCARCNGEESVMFRVQHKPGKTWVFLCKPCVEAVKVDNPFYRYGGTWKG